MKCHPLRNDYDAHIYLSDNFEVRELRQSHLNLIYGLLMDSGRTSRDTDSKADLEEQITVILLSHKYPDSGYALLNPSETS